MQAEIGSISSGTMQPRDLIPVFADVLADLDERNEYAELIEEAQALTEEDYDAAEDDKIDGGTRQQTVGFILEELFEALEACAPQGTYFGALDGDGADYGFWTVEEGEE